MSMGLHDMSGVAMESSAVDSECPESAVTAIDIVRDPSMDQALARIRTLIKDGLSRESIVVLPPMELLSTLKLMGALDFQFDTSMLDPWYNKGFGGTQEDYLPFFLDVIAKCARFSKHIYFWGFPEIVAPFVERLPKPLTLTCWLTWYYKNNPSVIRGWRSAQNACLHLSSPGALLYPQRFLNEKQLALQAKGKLRYMPGPTSVIDEGPADLIEQPLLVGFVGRSEQTGHPSQKPVRVYDQLLQMSVSDGGLVLDPMAGSGTSAIVAKNRGFRAIVCDGSEEYTSIIEKRTGTKRLDIESELTAFFGISSEARNKYLHHGSVKPSPKARESRKERSTQSSIF